MTDWPVLSHYAGDHLREVALPVGGIGTGFFALGGRGQLTDWQLMSRPHRGWKPPYAHLLLRTKQTSADGSQQAKLRVLEGDLIEGLAADSGAPAMLAGLPRIRDVRFEASYPFGRVLFHDPGLPVDVAVEAFNPLIPHATDDSSLPLGLLTVSLTNTTNVSCDASLSFLLTNFIGDDGITRDRKDNVTERVTIEHTGEQSGRWHGFRFVKAREMQNAQAGTLTVLCDAEDVRVARRWPFRDTPWGGEALGILDNLLTSGFLPDDAPDQPCPPSPEDTWDSSLSALFTLAPGETRQVRLLVTWHFPYRDLSQVSWDFEQRDYPLQRNYYATAFADSDDVARQTIPRLDDLRQRTRLFVESVVCRDAPHALREAALFNLTPLRSHTCFRLADGLFAAYEGCHGTTGCCYGSCTHVWNYEEATARLFPDLHRSMLDSHLRHATTPFGGNRFRLSLPLVNQTWKAAAADGQMGVIVRCYEQYLLDREKDGLEWLQNAYPTITSLMTYCWLPDGWDADKDGVMEGAQHNTYDVEFFGPNPLCTVWYLAALAAMEKMATLANDPDFAAECAQLRAKGSAWTDANLFNGEFYIQKVQMPPAVPAAMTMLGMVGEKTDEAPRFQVGPGCLIDQLVGQYKANRVGLGDLLDGDHVRSAVAAIFRHNYRANFRDHYNNMRTYATADESGTLIASYPNGGRPEVPLSYWGECMTGFEYQLAVLLLDYGYKEEGTLVAKAIRDRHNGANRNPFNEPECGSYYARCMAAWALLDAWQQGEASS